MLESRIGRPIPDRDWRAYLHSNDVPRGESALQQAEDYFRRQYRLARPETSRDDRPIDVNKRKETSPAKEKDPIDYLVDMALERPQVIGGIDFEHGTRVHFSPGLVILLDEDTTIEAIRQDWKDIARLRDAYYTRFGISLGEDYQGLRYLLFLLNTRGWPEWDPNVTVRIEQLPNGGQRWVPTPRPRKYTRWGFARIAKAVNCRIEQNLRNYVEDRCYVPDDQLPSVTCDTPGGGQLTLRYAPAEWSATRPRGRRLGATWRMLDSSLETKLHDTQDNQIPLEVGDRFPYDNNAAEVDATRRYFVPQEGGPNTPERILRCYSAMELLIGLGFSPEDARRVIDQGIERIRAAQAPFSSNGKPVTRYRVRDSFRGLLNDPRLARP